METVSKQKKHFPKLFPRHCSLFKNFIWVVTFLEFDSKESLKALSRKRNRFQLTSDVNFKFVGNEIKELARVTLRIEFSLSMILFYF